MDRYQSLIKKGRDFVCGWDKTDEFPSDQVKKLPQPPLVKKKMSENQIALPMNFKDLSMNNDFLSLLYNRCSRRIYTNETMSLLELSYLLWATQGVKSIRGNNYATLRTVPSGGARHAYETYLAIRNVEGLKDGAYHYLPMSNEIEFIKEIDDYQNSVARSLMGQTWAAKGNVVFYWAMVGYRCEWRYGVNAHRPALIDVGHIGQNLYMACESVGLGICAIAAFDHEYCAPMFNLDLDEEFVVYTCPVGKVKEEDKARENDIYAFVKDEKGAQE
ncbi:MAG: SagB/ThcOx family dehydrogenase [Erysipelotrichaceae bacterium]